jgi:hypothetical protein
MCGFTSLQQVHRDLDVALADRGFLHRARLVERQIEEVAVLSRHARILRARAGLGPPDQALDRLDLVDVNLARLLGVDEVDDVLEDLLGLGRAVAELQLPAHSCTKSASISTWSSNTAMLPEVWYATCTSCP